MVVMAIIAILATAGLSAYTGYMKKARDAVRIADIDAINKIVLASMSSTGVPPRPSAIATLVTAANNGVRLQDPLYATWLCTAASGWSFCSYRYRLCDVGTGYVIVDGFESPSNVSLLSQNTSGTAGGNVGTNIYDIGSCNANCSAGLCGSDWDWVNL